MKKILFVMFAFIALTFAACNSQVKSDIQNYEERVENVSFKEIEISNNFYEYTQDLSPYYNDFKFYHDKMKDAVNDFSYNVNMARIYERYDKKTKDALDKQQSEMEAIVAECSYKMDSISNFIENTKMMMQRGVLYVAKMKEFNKFGKKNDFYSFKVYAYNKDGSIHEYDGKDKMELVLTAYPDAMKEAGKALKQAFGV